MLKLDVNEANSIPILSVASYVVNRFVDKGKYSTGECCKHTDKNLGNLRFKIDDNYAHCFTCGESWSPVGLVMTFMNYEFPDALMYLYDHFSTYFTNVEEYEKKPKWKGLTNKEYKYLGINSQQRFGNIVMDVREFATCFPDEHDSLLLAKIIKKQEHIESLFIFLSDKVVPDKLKQDHLEIEDKLYQLLVKGLMNKTNTNMYKKIA